MSDSRYPNDPTPHDNSGPEDEAPEPAGPESLGGEDFPLPLSALEPDPKYPDMSHETFLLMKAAIEAQCNATTQRDERIKDLELDLKASERMREKTESELAAARGLPVASKLEWTPLDQALDEAEKARTVDVPSEVGANHGLTYHRCGHPVSDGAHSCNPATQPGAVEELDEMWIVSIMTVSGEWIPWTKSGWERSHILEPLPINKTYASAKMMSAINVQWGYGLKMETTKQFAATAQQAERIASLEAEAKRIQSKLFDAAEVASKFQVERDALAEQVLTLTDERTDLLNKLETNVGKLVVKGGSTDDGNPVFDLLEATQNDLDTARTTIDQLRKELEEVKKGSAFFESETKKLFGWICDTNDELASRGFGDLVGTQHKRVAQALDKVRSSLATTQAQVAALQADNERLETLDELAGAFQDDSFQTVGFYGDDATRTWHLKAGKQSWYASSIRGVIDAARTSTNDTKP